jgi:hypothetical protein
VHICAYGNQRLTSSVFQSYFTLLSGLFVYFETGFYFIVLLAWNLLCSPDWPQIHRDLLLPPSARIKDYAQLPPYFLRQAFLLLLLLLLLFFFFFFFFFFFRDRVSLCSPGCPGTHIVDQAGLELRNPPASASLVLGLKVCRFTGMGRFSGSRDLPVSTSSAMGLRCTSWAFTWIRGT